MKGISKLGNRGVVFTFEDDIGVYLIQTDTYWFLCDTHLGPQSMEIIKQYIAEQANNKAVIVFNSHSDWDHIWGNCAFPGALIIGHETCRKRMQEIGEFELELESLRQQHCGNIKLMLPNVTFNDRLLFADEEIEFIYAPGHTVDSAICFDRKDAVLFVGDLVEQPIPYLDYHDLATYIETLEFIKSFPAKSKLSAHSGIVDNDLIERNIAYITTILQENPTNPEIYQATPNVHNFNINNRLFLRYENRVREKLKDNFNYALFRRNFKDLKEVTYTDLQAELEQYMRKIV
ncbi:MAG: Zn-dependent hydrolase, glyoxylase [Firmicutes bacterium]|nr:Zn-dependent hydrolase, glyoxylase [Bacillota bacterium]